LFAYKIYLERAVQHQQRDTTPLNDAVKFKFRLNNKTTYSWKLKEEVSQVAFPKILDPNESKLIETKKFETDVSAIYVTEVKSAEEDTKIYQFQLNLICNDGEHFLIVNWMNSVDLNGIQFKPDLSSSHQPIRINTDEVLIELG